MAPPNRRNGCACWSNRIGARFRLVCMSLRRSVTALLAGASVLVFSACSVRPGVATVIDPSTELVGGYVTGSGGASGAAGAQVRQPSTPSILEAGMLGPWNGADDDNVPMLFLLGVAG